jgi:FkbM family methyltransferase
MEDWRRWLDVLRTLPARVRGMLAPRILKQWLGCHARSDLVKLGTAYGGWVVPTSLLTRESIVWCIGVGEDITFDLALIERFGCDVLGIDPTPRAAVHVRKVAGQELRYRFLPYGLWSEDSVQRFYAPRNPAHVSHSIANLQGTTSFFEASCKRPSTLLGELGQTHIDLLKLDVEGAEYAVLRALREDRIRPRILCVEFDQPASLRKIVEESRQLQRSGYVLVAVDRWNFTFVLEA